MNTPVADASNANSASLNASSTALKRMLDQVVESRIRLSALGVLLLAAIWGTTLNMIHVERVAAEHAAGVSSRELAETYEAQAVRALREIDQTLKLVKYAYELRGKQVALRELKAKALLPPDLLFVVSITDSKGNVVASTRQPELANVGGQDYFQAQLHNDALAVGHPRQGPSGKEWNLQFSRRVNAPDGSFSGIAMLSVDAAYFVSGYESSKLGEHGVLGILGTDGEFRARRSGETVSAGDKVNYAEAAPAVSETNTETALLTDPLDGVARYTSARPLYDFPLAVTVGLSADEQLASMRQDMHIYLWLASGGSLIVILIVALLARKSRQLALSRLRIVEEQIAHAARVEYLAYHDGLTTLPNRSLFSKLLMHSISQVHRNKKQLAVMFLDLDGFKHINDSLGHEAGDILLQEVSTRLKDCLRDSDIVARLGGDEFVVLLPELDDPKYIVAVAQKILASVARPFALFGQESRVTASIGISTYPQDGLDEQSLTKSADIAMYHAKEEGKNNFQFYAEKLNAYSAQRLSLEKGLRHAVANNEIQLHYQTKRDIRSGRITGVEALLRWQHPVLGQVAPLEFIPVAEETGQIVPIGKWVLRTACLQNVAWQNQGFPRFRMAVNLTWRQFSDLNLETDLKKILAETGMDAHLLELEISEGMLMRDVGRVLRILTRIKELGIRIAVDDFGIGYFSLSKFKQFPLDTVKIDRHFIQEIKDETLAQSIIAIGRTLSPTVVAQGVETKEQADFLRENACDEIQGFYLNKPLPAEQITELLQSQQLADRGARATSGT